MKVTGGWLKLPDSSRTIPKCQRALTLVRFNKSMGDLQDPTDGGTLVPYKAIFWGIFPYIGLKNRPYI